MNITCTISDTKNDVEETVRVEDWVNGRDEFLIIGPSHADNVYLKMLESKLVLECVDADGVAHTHVLRRFSE